MRQICDMVALTKEDLLGLATRPRRRGRPHGTAPYHEQDWVLCAKMHRLVVAGMSEGNAARQVASSAPGSMETRSRVLRLVERYRSEYLPWRTTFEAAVAIFTRAELSPPRAARNRAA